MDEVFNPIDLHYFMDGYSHGLDPAVLRYNCIKSFRIRDMNEAFRCGFESGRKEYESLNGKLCNGVPYQILNARALNECLLLGSLGMPLEKDAYNCEQQAEMKRWYEWGYSRNDRTPYEEMKEYLSECGISI